MLNVKALMISSLVALAGVAPSAYATDPEVLAQINAGDAEFAAGDSWLAQRYYIEAKRIAADRQDWEGMLTLAQRFLLVSDEWHAENSFGLAHNYAYDLAVPHPDRPGSGSDCAGGMTGLATLVNFWNGTLAAMPKSDATQSNMLWVANQGFNNWTWLNDNGCPGGSQPTAEIGVNAVAGNNSLADGYPTRGFGDSEQVDQWIPFHFDYGAPSQILAAKIVMVVKPIGQLIGTDTLVIRGASGTPRMVYDQFHTLNADQWNTVEVDVTGDADVMAAIRTGRVDALIQDDTAVYSVQLVLTIRPE